MILSLSLSLALLCVVVTGVESFRLDSYLESRLVGDVSIGSVRYTNLSSTVPDTMLDEEMETYMDSQPGITAAPGCMPAPIPEPCSLTRRRQACMKAGESRAFCGQGMTGATGLWNRPLKGGRYRPIPTGMTLPC